MVSPAVPVPRPVHVLLGERQGTGRQGVPVWFALEDERPLAFFAGIWTSWTSTRKLAEGEVTVDLFGS